MSEWPSFIRWKEQSTTPYDMNSEGKCAADSSCIAACVALTAIHCFTCCNYVARQPDPQGVPAVQCSLTTAQVQFQERISQMINTSPRDGTKSTHVSLWIYKALCHQVVFFLIHWGVQYSLVHGSQRHPATQWRSCSELKWCSRSWIERNKGKPRH